MLDPQSAPQSDPHRRTNKAIPTLVAGVIVVAAGIFGIDLAQNDAPSQQGQQGQQGQPNAETACPVADLPAEAADTIEDIYHGGPFEYPDNDGKHFGNYEGHLPDQHSHYYREYTVETPGLDHRGARRIVTGGDSADNPEVFYYTDDHYETFCEVNDA
ncbi:ribonuclease domain-containing protein [Corynebacterium cystitidis]|uniref:ribonuclease domain-containing protein n=1 Tax=Corynebacterium cystitidis TaxID=35757 RepID=UPI00211E1703|nr:ribonuclease domain-containing protein [Corynebacterium cystitidis]